MAIRVDLEAAIARVVIDRPAKLNALDSAMWQALAATFRDLGKDDDLRAVILSGAGGRAFCVGADISEFETHRRGKAQSIVYADMIHEAVNAITECQHPTVAAIDGLCVGGGVELAAACDLRLCSASSSFSVPIRRLGLPMDYPEMSGLRRLIGPSNTLELVLEGRRIDAAEALGKGLVNRVFPDAAFDEKVAEVARAIATGAPLVARWHKRMMRRLEDPAPVTKEEREAPLALFDSEDYAIGARAFLAKRTPTFVGR